MDLSATKDWIVETAQSYAVDVYFNIQPLGFKSQAGYNCAGWMCVSNLWESYLWIDIDYTSQTESDFLAWIFLHELGHIEQIERLGGVKKFVKEYRANMLPYEIEAWDRALPLVQSSPFPIDERFFEFRHRCLETYRFPISVTV